MGISVSVSLTNDFDETAGIMLTNRVIYGMFGNFGNVIII